MKEIEGSLILDNYHYFPFEKYGFSSEDLNSLSKFGLLKKTKIITGLGTLEEIDALFKKSFNLAVALFLKMSDDRDKLISNLKGKLWYCVERQVDEETPFDTTYTPKYTNALVELSYIQLIEMGKDLEAFARHAGRETITVDDMMLLLRKTPGLQEILLPKQRSLE